jgi:hypothetical protein
LHPPAGQPETLQIAIKGQQFPFIAQDRSIQIQGFALVVRTAAAITTLAMQIDPGTAGSNVYQPAFTPVDKNGFRTAMQNGGLGLPLDPTQPWIVQIGTKPAQFNTLKDGDILDCYLLIEYTLQ